MMLAWRVLTVKSWQLCIQTPTSCSQIEWSDFWGNSFESIR